MFAEQLDTAFYALQENVWTWATGNPFGAIFALIAVTLLVSSLSLGRR